MPLGCGGERQASTPAQKPTTQPLARQDSRPNVLVILVDTLRADHLGAYGYSRDTSPNIDKLAREGVMFEQAFSPSSFTRESVAALFTGKYPSSNPWGGGWLACPDPETPTLATLFAEQGYDTAMFFNNPVLADKTFYAGFDTQQQNKGHVSLSGHENALSRDALNYLDTVQNPEKPFFLYVHYLDPHAPYQPEDRFYYKFAPKKYPQPIPLVPDVRGHLPELLAEGFGPGDPRYDDLVLRYDAEIRMVDEAVGVLLNGLKMRNLDQDTIVVFLSDHGEEFLEHEFVEHCWDLRRESIHVPLLFRAPGITAPQRITEPVSTVNVLPTLLDLAGIPIPPGLDAYPLHESGVWKVRDDVPLFAELLIQSRLIMRMVQQGDYAYFAAPQWLDTAQRSAVSLAHQDILQEFESGARKPRPTWGEPEQEFLYDIRTDPLQQTDLLTDKPEVAARYRQILAEYQAQCPPAKTEAEQRALTGFGLTEEERQTLENLGYF